MVSQCELPTLLPVALALVAGCRSNACFVHGQSCIEATIDDFSLATAIAPGSGRGHGNRRDARPTTPAAACRWPWRRVRSMVVGEPLRRDSTTAERARRTETIAVQLIRSFTRRERRSRLSSPTLSGRAPPRTRSATWAGWSVSSCSAGLEIRSVQMSSARKLLLGKVPKSDPESRATRLCGQLGRDSRRRMRRRRSR